MSWRQLWGSEKETLEAEATDPIMPAYFSGLLAEAKQAAWDCVVANRVPTVIWAIFITALAGFLQFQFGLQSQEDMISGLLAALFGLGTTGIAALLAFLFFLLYLVPKRRVAKALKRIGDTERERDAARGEIERLEQSRRDQARNAADDCFEKASAILKEETVFPFNALSKAGGHLLGSNDQVIEVCDRLQQNGHSHPFGGLGGYVFESECLGFLNYVRHHADNAFINPEDGHDYLHAADRWRLKQGHPEPSHEQSLQMVFNKVFEATPPHGKRGIKGLKVSITSMDISKIENVISGISRQVLWQLSARLVFVNDGKTQRTIHEIKFVGQDPDESFKGLYTILGVVRADKESDNCPIMVPPDSSEVTANVKTYIAPELAEKHGAEFGLQINASDGKGGDSKERIIMMMTAARFENGNLNHFGKRVRSVSFDDED